MLLLCALLVCLATDPPTGPPDPPPLPPIDEYFSVAEACGPPYGYDEESRPQEGSGAMTRVAHYPDVEMQFHRGDSRRTWTLMEAYHRGQSTGLSRAELVAELPCLGRVPFAVSSYAIPDTQDTEGGVWPIIAFTLLPVIVLIAMIRQVRKTR